MLKSSFSPISFQNHGFKTFQFFAIKDINPGEEICTFYGGEIYWDEKTKTKLI